MSTALKMDHLNDRLCSLLAVPDDIMKQIRPRDQKEANKQTKNNWWGNGEDI